MSDALQIEASKAAEQPAPESRKHGADQRIQELLRDRKRDRELIADLERELSEAAKRADRQESEMQAIRSDLARWKTELAELRGFYEEQEKKLRDRIAAAREQGRRLFADFDAVVTGVSVDQNTFRALLASTNGAELMYALGLGLRVIAGMRQRQQQAEQVEYYRNLHRQHFSGTEGANGINSTSST